MLTYPLLSVTEVAAALGISERTVRRLVHSGALKSIVIGGRALYDMDTIRIGLGIPAPDDCLTPFKLFSCHEVAQTLGVSPAEVLRLTDSG